MISGPSPELSRQITGAIQAALREEKVPPAKRVGKALLASIGCTAILAAPLMLAFRQQIGMAWAIALFVWWLMLLVGFHLHYHPQPRIAVPGYWSPWVFARLLVAMVFLTAAEILLCPSFVFLESPLPWSPLEGLSHLFMAVGGMELCMFSCGLLFSSAGGVITFALVSKTMKGSGWEDILKGVGVVYVTQLPIVAIQVADPGLRPFVTYWMLGGLLGTGAVAVVVRAMAARLVGNVPTRTAS